MNEYHTLGHRRRGRTQKTLEGHTAWVCLSQMQYACVHSYVTASLASIRGFAQLSREVRLAGVGERIARGGIAEAQDCVCAWAMGTARLWARHGVSGVAWGVRADPRGICMFPAPHARSYGPEGRCGRAMDNQTEFRARGRPRTGGLHAMEVGTYSRGKTVKT